MNIHIKQMSKIFIDYELTFVIILIIDIYWALLDPRDSGCSVWESSAFQTEKMTSGPYIILSTNNWSGCFSSRVSFTKFVWKYLIQSSDERFHKSTTRGTMDGWSLIYDHTPNTNDNSRSWTVRMKGEKPFASLV